VGGESGPGIISKTVNNDLPGLNLYQANRGYMNYGNPGTPNVVQPRVSCTDAHPSHFVPARARRQAPTVLELPGKRQLIIGIV